jgi:hypothetical protein
MKTQANNKRRPNFRDLGNIEKTIYRFPLTTGELVIRISREKRKR